MVLQINQNRIALGIILLEVHRADFDEHLELVPNEDVTGDGNGSFVFEGDCGRDRCLASGSVEVRRNGDDSIAKHVIR